MFGFLMTNRCLRFQIFCSRMLAAFQFSIQFHFTAIVIYTVWHEIFADWRFFVFCGTDYFLLLGQIGFTCRELIFAIFGKYPAPSIDNIFVDSFKQ